MKKNEKNDFFEKFENLKNNFKKNDKFETKKRRENKNKMKTTNKIKISKCSIDLKNFKKK